MTEEPDEFFEFTAEDYYRILATKKEGEDIYMVTLLWMNEGHILLGMIVLKKNINYNFLVLLRYMGMS